MYQHGSEYTCQSPSASKEQKKMAAHLPKVLKGRSALQYSQNCHKLFHLHLAGGDKATEEIK